MTIISLTCLVQVSCIIDSILALVDAGGWNFTSISSASTATAMMSLSCIFKYFTVHIFILCVLIQARLHVFMFLKLYPFGLVSSPSSSFQSSSMLILYTNIIIPFMAVATMIVYLLTDTIHPEIFNKDPIHLRFIVTMLFATTCILPTFYLQRLIVLKVLEHFHAKKVTFHASRASYYNNNNNKQQQRHPNIVKSSSLATSRKQHGGDGEDSSNEYDEGNGGSSGSSGIHMRRPGDYARQMDLVVCGPITFTGTLSLVNSNNNNNNSNINNNQLPIIPSYDSLDSILDTTSTTVAAYSPAIPMKKMKLARSSISSFAGKSSSPPPPPPHSTSKALPAVTRFSGGVDSTISSEGRRFYVAQQQKLAHWKSQRTNSIERRVHATVISVFALGSLSLVMTAVGEFWTPHLLTGILKVIIILERYRTSYFYSQIILSLLMLAKDPIRACRIFMLLECQFL